MAITTVPLTGKLTAPGSGGIPVRGTVAAFPNTKDYALSFSADNENTLGPVVADVEADGSFELAIPINSDQQSGLFWTIVVRSNDRVPGIGSAAGKKVIWTVGTFAITVAVDLADLEAVEVTAVSATVLTDMAALIDEAEAHAAAVEAVVATNDGIMAANVGTGGLFDTELRRNVTVEGADPAATGTDIATGTGWTLGTGWTGTFAGGFVHATGNTAALTSPSVPAGRWLVTFDSSTALTSVPDLLVSLGDQASAYLFASTSSTTHTAGFVTTAAGPLTFTPTTDYAGTISNISIEPVSATTRPAVEWMPTLENLFAGDVAGRYNVSGWRNAVTGITSFGENVSGYWNVGYGIEVLTDNTNGTRNTALGMRSLSRNRSGYRNVGVGQSCLRDNINGNENIAVGADALYLNATPDRHIAIGTGAMYQSVGGSKSVHIGYYAGGSANGSYNVGIGDNALYTSDGTWNVGIGLDAASGIAGAFRVIGIGRTAANVAGNDNVAVGDRAIRHQTGTNNVGIGTNALTGIAGSSGARNVAVGYDVGKATTTGSRNVLIGDNVGMAITTGSTNTIVGPSSGSTVITGSGNILLGFAAELSSGDSSNQMSLGNTIYGDLSGKRIGIGRAGSLITAALHIKSGTAAAGTAPLKLTSGTVLTTPEAGAFEYDGTNLYFTPTAGVRKTVTLV